MADLKEILGEIPKKFLDAVRGTLMEDPVSVPTSEWIFDREVIEEFIEICNCDPFTNKFLNTDMLVPEVELKAEIQSFIESKKKISQEQSMQSAIKETTQTKKDSDPIKKKKGYMFYPNAAKLDPDHLKLKENIPVEFMDSLMYTLMEDPVVLPSGSRMDRAVIRKHISKFHIDPFSGNYLAEDMLVSDDSLKVRIEEFISSSHVQSSPGAQDDYSDYEIHYYPPRAKFDIDVSHELIPKEFLDSLDNEIMEYPVILPSGRRVDRNNINDYMWESPVDPFSGRRLTVDMLVSDRDLQKRIEGFISYIGQRNMQSTTKETMQSGSDTCKNSPRAQNESDQLDDVNPECIPTEFLDELALTLMKDPVVLPSSARMDRAIIQSHISEFHIDPFTGSYLTDDMLVSDDDLKARIEEFISASRARRARSNAIEEKIRAINCLDIKDIPMEFLDSLESTLMRDPVILPSGHRVDRSVILNRISKFPVDPFFGKHLTEDMLVSDDNLQARIDEFISSLLGRISMQKTNAEAQIYESSSGTQTEKQQNIANTMEGMSLEVKGSMPSKFGGSRDNKTSSVYSKMPKKIE